MPLFPLSPNIQESEAASRKRSHDEFASGADVKVLGAPSSPTIACEEDISSGKGASDHSAPAKSFDMSATAAAEYSTQLLAVPDITMKSPTPGSSPAALTEAGSSTPARNSPSPNATPSKIPAATQNGTSGQDTSGSASTTANAPNTQASVAAQKPTKRKLTTAEKEEREREQAEKKRKRDEKAAEKAAEKAKLDAEREAKRRKKEEKDEEKAKQRKQKEDEELAVKRKQEKQASVMANFFKAAPSKNTKNVTQNPAPGNPDSSAANDTSTATPAKEASEYNRRFQPFYIKPEVRLAQSPFQLDEKSKCHKLQKLDEYINGTHEPVSRKPFDPVESLQLSGLPTPRGIIPKSVKTIMEAVYGDPLHNSFGVKSMAISSESQTERLASAQQQLDQIPVKYLKFREDVRPPYIGTITKSMTTRKLRELSRRPTGKILATYLDYEYDSEAEWVEDDGEDLEDCEDDEEDDGDEEMDDFLDDSEDAVQARPAFLGENEPTSTGICFENRKRLGPSATAYKFRMEFLLDSLDHHSGIDPFSKAYWEPVPAATAPRGPATITESKDVRSMPPPAAPSDAFSALGASSAPAPSDKDLVPQDMMSDFKSALVGPDIKVHTKMTVVDLLSKRFPRCTKSQIKTTIDKVAHRVPVPGEKKSVKAWALISAS